MTVPSFENDNSLESTYLAFRPAMMRLQKTQPSPLGRKLLLSLLGLFAILVVWAFWGQLDIVAVAQGKLVPRTQLKIVQPSEAGIVKEILVHEGDIVQQGQVLMRMDGTVVDAQRITLENDRQNYRLALRRIDAELAGQPLAHERSDPDLLFAGIQAQFLANRQAQASAIEEQQSVLEKAKHDLSAAEANKMRIKEALVHFRKQDEAYDRLSREGNIALLEATDKHRERQERENELTSQEFVIQSARAEIERAEKQIVQIKADYKRRLQTERVETSAKLTAVEQELAKEDHRHRLLELVAPQDGIVKDLATHTIGTVVSTGTIMMNLVPKQEELQAEVWIDNQDIGFVESGMVSKVKLNTFTFQKYGMLDGVVDQVSADSSTQASQEQDSVEKSKKDKLVYKSIVKLADQVLEYDGKRYPLVPGMEVVVEIKLGTRSLLEYLFSPVKKTVLEACRER